MICIQKPIVIFLMGPTTSGKTDFAILLNNYLPINIISVDSGLIYKYMNIGTAKPSVEQLKMVPHYLVNIVDPVEIYSIFRFKKDVLQAIKDSINSHRIPVLVGGTMLYYHVLLHGWHPTPPKNIYFQNKMLSCIHKPEKLKYLYTYLKKIDPLSAKLIHKNDSRRIIRALNIYFSTGLTTSFFKKQDGVRFPYKVIQFSMVVSNRFIAHERIKTRFFHMLELGFQKEVEELFNRGDLNANLPSIRCVGYRQMWSYLNNEISYQDMQKKSIYATCQLYKKQITWLKKWKNIYFLNIENKQLSLDMMLIILKKNMNLNL
ncbi:tRNA (adenosine(37)-N6)-dimethylallyltransferase MiaA [Buchnera aphidicola (Thelaxes californica)]|uniref:tRNA dimethylallyltransferase n=1 Tax=Buchnera aphidicola (Thelaxes californica) TaxID=1315998 RepID=A0A4D6YLP3_9GAMM|nr:tRNA (adenosine(37)-N6)-dimethylallyltransferase MiaA [Buchnera aphidicola]QCI26960.1 tRNA (adenosine(37)-N6)-dimethylallyltransferase MiaA [Buchnera aphidicola (Thelaxes californica)]